MRRDEVSFAARDSLAPVGVVWDDVLAVAPKPEEDEMSGNKITTRSIAILGLLVALSVPALAIAQEPPPPVQELEKSFPKKPPYSPYAGRHFPERVYWGDTHLHTSFSMDAGAFGCRLGPRDAYRFAKGHEVTASSGQPARLARPLDFLVVADHSDGFGFFPLDDEW